MGIPKRQCCSEFDANSNDTTHLSVTALHRVVYGVILSLYSVVQL